MKHAASNNWGNTRKDPEKGIQVAPHPPVERVVTLLLASPEAEAVDFVRRHSGNTAWLAMALKIESAKRKPNETVIRTITSFLNH